VSLKKIRVIMILLRISIKVYLMTPKKRDLFLELFRRNTADSRTLTNSQKVAIYDYIDKLKKTCEDK